MLENKNCIQFCTRCPPKLNKTVYTWVLSAPAKINRFSPASSKAQPRADIDTDLLATINKWVFHALNVKFTNFLEHQKWDNQSVTLSWSLQRKLWLPHQKYKDFKILINFSLIPLWTPAWLDNRLLSSWPPHPLPTSPRWRGYQLLDPYPPALPSMVSHLL